MKLDKYCIITLIIFVLGLFIIFALTPVGTLFIDYFLNQSTLRATDLEVPFKYREYLESGGTLFEKILGFFGLICEGDYSLLSIVIVTLPIFFTFIINFIQAVLLFRNENYRLLLSLSFSIALTLNPFFLAWFSLPYLFFYFLISSYIFYSYFYLLKGQISQRKRIITFFALTLLCFGLLWDISFHFIPYLFFSEILMILILVNDKKDKLKLLFLFSMSVALSTMLSTRTIPTLIFQNIGSTVENLQDFWKDTGPTSILSLTGGTWSNYYLNSYAKFSKQLNFCIPAFITLSFFIFKRTKKIMPQLTLYVSILSLGFMSLCINNFSYEISSFTKSTILEKIVNSFLLINRRPERPLTIIWIIAWLVIFNILLYILRGDRESLRNFKYLRKLFLLFFLIIFVVSVFLPTMAGKNLLEEQHLKFIDNQMFSEYLRFLDITNNVTYGKSFFLPFYTNIMMDNRINYGKTLFYSSYFDISQKTEYKTLLTIINNTFSEVNNSTTPTYAKLNKFKQFIIGCKLANITKIGILSSSFSENEFQNWRLQGPPRISYPYIWGNPKFFKKRFIELLDTFTSIENKTNNILKISEFDGYTIIELSTNYEYAEGKIYIPKVLEGKPKIDAVKFISETIPNSLLKDLLNCKKLDVVYNTSEEELVIKIGSKVITVKRCCEVISIEELFGNAVYQKNIRSMGEGLFTVNGSFYSWYKIDKPKLQALVDNDAKIGFSIEGNIKNPWIRVLDKNGSIIYNFHPSCYIVEEILNSEAFFIAISGSSTTSSEIIVLRMEICSLKVLNGS